MRAKAVYFPWGVNMDEKKEILDLWIAQTEGAKFWLQVVAELKNRWDALATQAVEIHWVGSQTKSGKAIGGCTGQRILQ